MSNATISSAIAIVYVVMWLACLAKLALVTNSKPCYYQSMDKQSKDEVAQRRLELEALLRRSDRGPCKHPEVGSNGVCKRCGVVAILFPDQK